MLVPGFSQQKVVCQVAGNPKDSPVWWFVDGRASGSTKGTEPYVTEMSVGAHTIICSTAEGVTASVSIRVEAE